MFNNIVYAIHDFEAETEDELNFQVGEPILILEKDDKYADGWWQGRNRNGEIGLFPKNYTSPEKPLQDSQDNIVSQLQVASPMDYKKPEKWTVQQVANWLASVGLSAVSKNFIDQEITGDILLDLNIDTLKELGISTFGKRYKIMQAIQTLKEIKLPIPHASVSASTLSSNRKPKLKKSTSTTRLSNKKLLTTIERPVSPQSLSSSSFSSSMKTEDRTSFDPTRVMYNDAPPTPIPSVSTPTQSMMNAHKLSDELQVSTAEYFEAPEHEGWLHKQSDKYKTWNKRWFVLKGFNLFYFKSPKDVRMKGIINLRGYKIIIDESIHAGKYCFKIQHENERIFYFYTDTEDSMRDWIKMLMKTTIARDFKAPVMSSNQISTVPLDIARRMRPRPPSVIMYKVQKSKSTPTRRAHEPAIPEQEHPPQMDLPKIPAYKEEEDLIGPHQKDTF